ncbi:hypothetical protein AD951_04460 [Acetobacter malorum]|uniref:Uncharacterized protein n=1 Tax=Acetobacter malorum TaxID=178901 RepID=A0A149UQ19_9PROT|nr:hypothetical protein [Acetobacter malorum]KXV69934.1 hypothetical protein AD951_04460 [Acetobacter malorum]
MIPHPHLHPHHTATALWGLATDIVVIAALFYLLTRPWFAQSDRPHGRLWKSALLRYVYPRSVIQCCVLWIIVLSLDQMGFRFNPAVAIMVTMSVGGALTLVLGLTVVAFFVANVVIAAFLAVLRVRSPVLTAMALLPIPGIVFFLPFCGGDDSFAWVSIFALAALPPTVLWFWRVLRADVSAPLSPVVKGSVR